MLRSACLVATALMIAISAASASIGEGASCELIRPHDGFVALRTGPDRSTELLVRMDPDGAVIQTGEFSGRWWRVIYWPPGTDYDEAVRTGAVGWMHSSLTPGCG